jgi:hypothetical protein
MSAPKTDSSVVDMVFNSTGLFPWYLLHGYHKLSPIYSGLNAEPRGSRPAITVGQIRP